MSKPDASPPLAIHAEPIREEERQRIARDLHDELGSHLTAIKMALAQIQWQLNAAPPANVATLQAHSEYADQLVDGAISAMHDIIDDLHPAILDLGLPAALEWLGKSFARQTGVPHQIDIDSAAATLALEMFQTVSLYRIAREALHNAARHAAAHKLEICLQLQDTQLSLTIADDGIGLPAGATASSSGTGLRSMRARAAAIGASLALQSSGAGGTKLQVSLPATVFLAPKLIE